MAATRDRIPCGVCGGQSFVFNRVLWPQLVADWQLTAHEAHYIDRQQGEICASCHCNLRSIALANALRAHWATSSLLTDFVRSKAAADIALLELNQAGNLTHWLEQLPGHRFGAYPEVDMQSMPYADASFDVVVHSDTLEHVPNPVRALQECRRVLKPGGALCFTVPVVVARQTRSRAGLPPSYHGDPATGAQDYLVHTEFGVDAWTLLFDAGFDSVSTHAVEYPAALSFCARSFPG